MIKIYNTLTRKKEIFQPIDYGKVKMYVCGPTVYNYIHIGNARPLIIFDTVRSYLEYRGYEVTYVQNFTDIDDKIIKKANETGEQAKEISERYIKEYFNDTKELGIKKADIHPKVTENMDEIIDFIKQLENKKVAYNADGDVYFKTEKFNGYGKLSKQSIGDLNAGARVEIEEKKENPLDFALWKSAKPGEVSWDSPWGKGRPGWHIECSAMANKYLGETIDIHAGGADLIFPHHENEIAQSESITEKPFANYWMHNGIININNEKMSKSLGNFHSVNELIQKYNPLELRFLILSVHYRNPINFSEDLIYQSARSIERIKTAFSNIEHRLEGTDTMQGEDEELQLSLERLVKRFEQEMEDDFNTANAITVIFDLVKQVNLYIQNEQVYKNTLISMIEILKSWLNILGLDNILKQDDAQNSQDSWIEELIEERNIAKKNKVWSKADEIRSQLKKEGILIEDTPQGVRWRKI